MENPRSDLKDMSGTVCVVTGANSGIGKAAAAELARLGARVVMVCRNEGRGREARAEIQAAAELAHPSREDTVDLLIADLSVQEEVYHLGETIRADYDRLDVLINNAGVFSETREETVDGIADPRQHEERETPATRFLAVVERGFQERDRRRPEQHGE